MITAVKKSLSLKVSLSLAITTLLLISIVGYFIVAKETQNMEDMTISKARLSAVVGAQSFGRALDDAVDNNYVTINDVFDKNYQEIKGYDWGGKPKFHTKYDFYTDRVVPALQDRFLDTEDFVYAVGADSGGYVPTHNARYQKRITGDAAKDIVNNRTKRVFTDDVMKKAVANKEGVLVQSHVQDTGDRMWDVSAPIFVRGKHWGSFRIGVSEEQVAKKKSSLLWSLVIMFGAFAAITTGLIFVLINRSIKPLVDLTKLADQISIGEGLENKVALPTIDEVGQMAKSVDRLRASLKAAMARLGE